MPLNLTASLMPNAFMPVAKLRSGTRESLTLTPGSAPDIAYVAPLLTGFAVSNFVNETNTSHVALTGKPLTTPVSVSIHQDNAQVSVVAQRDVPDMIGSPAALATGAPLPRVTQVLEIAYTRPAQPALTSPSASAAATLTVDVGKRPLSEPASTLELPTKQTSPLPTGGLLTDVQQHYFSNELRSFLNQPLSLPVASPTTDAAATPLNSAEPVKRFLGYLA
jgi:hypothetical protein